MTYLLDTNIMIFMLRGLKAGKRAHAKREKAAFLVERCRTAHREGHVLGLSAITVAELMYGAHLSERYDDEMVSLAKILAPFECFDWDAVSAPAHYGRIRHILEQQGQIIGPLDLLIAAHALSLDATVVTNNLSHFRRVPDLRVEDWSG
jgi:tRNA(fMet)-specific endonuclease VapC